MKILIKAGIASLVFYCAQPAKAAPRGPVPPWPEKSLATFGWDEAYWFIPARQRAIGAEQADVAESWSGI